MFPGQTYPVRLIGFVILIDLGGKDKLIPWDVESLESNAHLPFSLAKAYMITRIP